MTNASPYFNRVVTPARNLDVMFLCDWFNHFGGQNNVNKIVIKGDQASNIEESGEFISITECQRDQKVTTAVHAFTKAQIINYFIEDVAGDKEKTSETRVVVSNI